MAPWSGIALFIMYAAIYFCTALLRIPTQNEAAWLSEKYILAARWDKKSELNIPADK